MIRPELASDASSIHAVHAAAFPTSAEADLVDRLRANGRLDCSLVAEIDGKIVGHVAFSPVTVEPASVARGTGLAPIAVLPAHQRKGFGAALIREGIRACERAGFAYIVVLGEPDYYRRFDFKPAEPRGLGNEYGAHDEFMVLELQSGALNNTRGLVRYSPEFAQL